MMPELPELKLKPKEEHRIKAGHCWIFSNELQHVDTTLKSGALCRVVSATAEPLGTGFFNPHSLIAVRLLSRWREPLEQDFVFSRLERAYNYRLELGLDKYARMCFGEGDFMPGLVIDRYGDFVAVDILAAGMECLKPEIIAAINALFRPKGIFLRNSSEFRKLEGLSQEPEIIGEIPDTVEITDGGVKYLVPLKTGQKTGFFYDQRDNKEFLAPFFKGRSVLDLYCYLGGFALKAAAGGASQVWGIDSSASAIGYAKKNAELNDCADTVSFHKEDAERALSAARSGSLPVKPDFIVLDPPNLVRNKKHLPHALKLYVQLNAMALESLPRGGYLATSSCSHHVSREIFEEILQNAARRSRKRVHLIELRGQAKDHPMLIGMPETRYLHFALLRVS